VTLFDANSGQAVGQIASAGEVTSLALSADNQHLAAGEADGTVRVYDIRNSRQILALTSHYGAVQSLTFHEGGKQITGIAWGGRFMVDAATGKVTGTAQ
jgi:WD40 repeat protein